MKSHHDGIGLLRDQPTGSGTLRSSLSTENIQPPHHPVRLVFPGMAADRRPRHASIANLTVLERTQRRRDIVGVFFGDDQMSNSACRRVRSRRESGRFSKCMIKLR